MGLEQGTLGNVRGQDIAGMQNANATGLGYGQLGQGYQDLAAKYRLGGAATQLGYEGLANQAGQFGDTLRNQILGQQLNADTAKYGADKGVAVGMANVNQREDAANMSMLGTLVGGAMAASDIRAKKNIAPAEASPSLRDVFGSDRTPDEYGKEDIVDPWAKGPKYEPVDTSSWNDGYGMEPDAAPVVRDSSGRMFWDTDVGHLPLRPDEADAQPRNDLRPARRGMAEDTSQLDEAYARQQRDTGPRFSHSNTRYTPVDTSAWNEGYGMDPDAAPIVRDAQGRMYWDLDAGHRPLRPEEADAAPRNDLRPARAYSYEYKNPAAVGAGPGRYVGPMAQDLEKTPAGASAVVDTPRGKAVDTGRLALVNSSAISETQRKQDEQASKLQELYDLLDMGNARASRNVGARR